MPARELYDALIAGIPQGIRVEKVLYGERWTLAENSAGGCGLTMASDWAHRPPLFPEGLEGKDLREAASAVRSWNLREASAGLAAANSYYNTTERLRTLRCFEPFGNSCTAGLLLTNKRVALIGHLKMPEDMFSCAAEVSVLEREPVSGDYPDSACEYIVPICDLVIITGSALVNKTLPRLLELARDACVILVGPSVPMCPELLGFGIDRLAGLAPNDAKGLEEHVAGGGRSSPYPYGETFLLKK